MTTWLAEQKNIYFGNANSIKEYRIQLRNSRTAWYWGAYLGILILVAVSNYSSIVSMSGSQSPSIVQQSLIGYYQMVAGFVNAGILLIAPMIAAATIVNEFELRSMELVQCAPTTTKYFFVGKFIATIRQVFLLLFLSLPIAAVGVTLGGATWSQIIEQFSFIGMQGALAAALAMPIAVATKSIIRSVTGVVCFGILFSIFASILSAPMLALGGGTSVPPFVGLIPFAATLAVGQSFPIFGMSVPLWFVTLLIALLICKVLILGAGSALTRIGSKETVSLRIHGLVLVGLYALIVTVVALSFPPSASASPDRISQTFASIGTPMLMAFLLILNIGAHGRLEERKFFADRFFEWKDIFRGTPSGALGYSLLTVLIVGLGTSIPLVISGLGEPLAAILSVVWGVAVAIFMFGLVWWISTFFDQATAGRRMASGALFAFAAVLHFFGIALDSARQNYNMVNTVMINIFLPVATFHYVIAVKALVLLGAGILLVRMGEVRRKKNLQVLRDAGYLVDRDEIRQQRT